MGKTLEAHFTQKMQYTMCCCDLRTEVIKREDGARSGWLTTALNNFLRGNCALKKN